MAQRILTAHEADSWNPALRPEDDTSPAFATSTGGGLSDLLAAADDSREASAPDLKSPLSEEDFSAWDTAHEPNAISPLDAKVDSISGVAPATLDAAGVDAQKSESTTELISSDVVTSMKTPENPMDPFSTGAEPAQPQPAQRPAPPVEATFTSTESTEDLSDPFPKDEQPAQPHSDEQQGPAAEVEDENDSKESATQEATQAEVQEQPRFDAVAVQSLQPRADDHLAPSAEAGDTENNKKLIVEVDAPPTLNEDLDLGAADAQPTNPSLDQPQALPVDLGEQAEVKEAEIEASIQPDVKEQPGFDATPVETKTNGSDLWDAQANGDVDSDGDEFFNQLKTQTKPIFAPPESESRFEEGVPLLDETNPISPPRTVPHEKPVNNFFAQDEDDGEDFFSSIQKPEVREEPPVHITRKSTSQVVESIGFGIDSPTSDTSAAAQLDHVLKAAASEPPAPQMPELQTEAREPSEEELAARWEAELSDNGEDDLAARWEAALDDDDMLLEDDVAQPPTLEQPLVPQSPIPSTNNAAPTGLNSPFETPQSYARPRPVPGMYTPHQPTTADLVQGVSVPGAAPPANAAVAPYFSQQPQNPVTTRGESFAERSKQGYKSPYDLPDDLSRPRRPIVTAKPVPPQVDNSMPPPPPRDNGTMQPPASSAMSPPAAAPAPAAAPPPAPKSFYEELPLPPPRSRPASSGRYTPGPGAAAPTGPALAPPPQNPYAPAVANAAPPAGPTNIPQVQSSLQPPERLEPFAPALASSTPAGPSTASSYSPKPPGSQASGKPPSLPRYSPAPPPSASSARNRYASQPLSVPGHTNSLPFQPRTSSPLAYHEKVSYQPEEAQQHPPPSLQPSVELSPPRALQPSIDQGSPYAPQIPNGPANVAHQENASPPMAQRQTPPPPKSRYAPPEYINEFTKRVTPSNNYAPAAPPMAVPTSPPTTDTQMAPRRSQTQSPGQQMTNPKAFVPPIQTLPRPASVHGSSSPTKTANPYAPTQPSVQSRARALSQRLDFIPPTDGQEYDTLERWKGAPIFKFGFGGAVMSCFPQHIPRYSVGQTAPMIKPSPGEPKFSQLNTLLPATETIVQHPGPLKTKSKKKEVLAWLSSKIAAFENEPTSGFDQTHPDSQKRHEEKILLWKVTKILVENDGALEGSAEIQKSFRQAIFPQLSESGPNDSYGDAFSNQRGSMPLDVPSQPDAVDPRSIEDLRDSLLQGDGVKAVWAAVDRRLWGHAMIIASTMDRSVWKQVVQEFVRREIRSSTANTESLAALYEIFAGNVEESIDELVPPSARAGHQLISKAGGHGTIKNALDGLDSWRDTLGLVLSNRSSEDHQALLALGRLLASYGRTEAAHICFIFSRAAIFGGADDPQANIVLLGVDHQRLPSALVDEDAILLTEIYEYAMSVLGNSPVANLPYLLAFKLLHAKQLADRGRTSEAQNYCDGVAAALKASTRPSPYHHQHVFIEVDELSARLRQTTSDGGSSWISKPSMEKVSGSMWARFNSFVVGDDSDAASTGSGKAGEAADFGPFANVAGTPIVSRSPSVSDTYGSYPGPGAQPMPAGGSSRYLPSNQHAPNASPENFRGRSSMDSPRSTSLGGMPHGQRRSSQEYPSPPVDSYMSQGAPIYGSSGVVGYQPTPPQSSYMPLAPVEEDASIHTQSPAEAAPPMQPAVNGLFYQPSGQDASSAGQSPFYQGPPGMPQSENPSYMPLAASNTYEPPSYAADVNLAPAETEEHAAEEEPQPKKKAFMDDDDDEDLAARAAAIKKAENDRKADEAFRKAAEEDGRTPESQVFLISHANLDYSQKRLPAIRKEGMVRWMVRRCQEGSRQRRRWSHQSQTRRGELVLL